jgi:hypothetical protein
LGVRGKQDLCEPEASLVYRAPAQPGLHRKTLSQKIKTKTTLLLKKKKKKKKTIIYFYSKIPISFYFLTISSKFSIPELQQKENKCIA